MSRLTVRFWGVRGSIACGGREFAQVGGNTSCVEVRADDQLIILDAGTGLFPLGQTLGEPVEATILLSHFHWDHIQGFPLFRPAYQASNRFTIYGPGEQGADLQAALDRQMQPPHFPVGFGALAARLQFEPTRPGDELQIGPARVRVAALNHPQGCLAYRITVGDTSLVYASDTEPLHSGGLDPALVDFVYGTDLLIYDAQYTDDEYLGRVGPPRRGWGHSTIGEACRIAWTAAVKQLVLFHHDPTHDDRIVEDLLAQARASFPHTIAAREGLTLSLPRETARWRASSPRARGRAVEHGGIADTAAPHLMQRARW